MKTKIFQLLIISNIIIACNNTKSYQTENRLSPDEWLTAWNQAYNDCYESLPPLQATPQNIDPYEDLMEQITFQPYVDRSNEIELQMLEKYPELCAYRQIEEYENKLQEQNDQAQKLINELEHLGQERRERFIIENEEWLKQFNKSVLDAIQNINYYP